MQCVIIKKKLNRWWFMVDCAKQLWVVLMKRSTWVDVETGGRVGCNGEIFWSECVECDCAYCNPSYVCVCSDKVYFITNNTFTDHLSAWLTTIAALFLYTYLFLNYQIYLITRNVYWQKYKRIIGSSFEAISPDVENANWRMMVYDS